ncbi:MAG: Phosphoheptose isomerase [Elusimicrobia bacterium]|nr:Phosphoheptose isomerase [Elusimicrobiota bacterium]
MNEKEWLSNYFSQYQKSIPQVSVYKDLVELKNWIVEAHKAGKKTIFVGNGGSAAMASHCAVDFTKTAGIRAVNFNEADLITCFANDYGYENWVQKALEFYADKGDVVVLISSSGKSPNMVHASQWAAKQGFRLATVTGFSSQNPMKSLGKINLWVDSTSYNIVENTHLVWLLSVCDLIIEEQKGA